MDPRQPDIAGIINACERKASRRGYDALTPAELTVYLVSGLRFEVELGGLKTFYYNSPGDHAPEVARALGAIGATRAAAALSLANNVLKGPGTTWPDHHQRFGRWAGVAEFQWREWERGLESDEPRSYQGLLDDFVARHAKGLPSPE